MSTVTATPARQLMSHSDAKRHNGMRHFETFMLAKMNQLQDVLEQEELEKTRREREVKEAEMEKAVAKRQSAASASKLVEIEAAMAAAQDENAALLDRKRAEADERLALREQEVERARLIEAMKREKVRKAMLKKQREIKEKAMREQAALAEERRVLAERKEASLCARIAAEKEALQKKNAEKAAASCAKAERSAQLRRQQMEEQRQELEQRNALLEKRAHERAAEEEKRLRENRERLAAKKAQLQKAREYRVKSMQDKRRATLIEEERKELAMQRRAHEQEQLRRERQYERNLLMAAQKQRTEHSMLQLQGRLDNLDRMITARTERSDLLERAKQAKIEEQRRLSRSVSLNRHALSNSIKKMQNSRSNPDLKISIPARVRRSLEKPELRSFFEACDPEGKGIVTLGTVRNLLAEARACVSIDPLEDSSPHRSLAKMGSPKRLLFSLSSEKLLLNPAVDHDDKFEVLYRAFKEVDTDGSGFISKRELYSVLEKAGMTQPGPNAMSSTAFLHTFEGFDVSGDAKISFEEFIPFAQAIVKSSPHS